MQTYRYYDAEPETVTAAQERTEMVRRALGAVIREQTEDAWLRCAARSRRRTARPCST
ncbi:MAG: hypothetical protein ACLR4Z_10875 [Butyricicoccaceae bacterium]